MTSTFEKFIDLNADLGEHAGDGGAADTALMRVVSSASIACGAHAGSPRVMQETVEMAVHHGVVIGAHPSYADREGFGRRELGLPVEEIAASVLRQIEDLADCCARAGARLSYVKPHGALYNRAVHDQRLARALIETIRRVEPALAVLSLDSSVLLREAADAGLAIAREAFIDRAYMPDGTLAPRQQPGSVLHDAELVAARALRIAAEHEVDAVGASCITVRADSLCVHGDSPDALAMITAARARLESAGFKIRPFVA